MPRTNSPRRHVLRASWASAGVGLVVLTTRLRDAMKGLRRLPRRSFVGKVRQRHYADQPLVAVQDGLAEHSRRFARAVPAATGRYLRDCHPPAYVFIPLVGIGDRVYGMGDYKAFGSGVEVT